RIRAEHVALTQERREGARERRGRSAERSRADEHVREAGMEPQTRHLLPLLGDAVTIVDRIERGEELPRLRERGARRRVEPAQLERIDDSGGGQLEREGREIRLENLRRHSRYQGRVLALRPPAVAHAG